MLILVGYTSDFLEDLVLLDFFNSVGAKEKEKPLSSHENLNFAADKRQEDIKGVYLD